MRKVFFVLMLFIGAFFVVSCIDEAITFEVVFETNGGSLIDPMVIDPSRVPDRPNDPTKEMYLFDGWYLDESLESPVNWETLFQDGITQNITLYAKWKVDEQRLHQVVYDPLEELSPWHEDVFDQALLDEPVLDLESHTLEGWYLSDDDGLTVLRMWDFEIDRVTEDMTLYALWVIKTYAVTFVDDDGLTVIKTESVNHGGAAIPPEDPLKEADDQYTYHFTGWDQDTSSVTADTTVYALYDAIINQYTITFLDADGTAIQEGTYDYGTVIVAPPDPTSEGFHFDGWDTAFDVVTGDMIITATYVSNTHIVRFIADDGITVLKTEEVNHGTAAIPPDAPEKDMTEQYSYVFSGWDQDTSEVMSDMDVYAEYIETLRSYTIVFLDDDERVIMEEILEYGRVIQPPEDPVKPGMMFAGWDQSFDTVIGDQTMMATYTVKLYHVTYYEGDAMTLLQDNTYLLGADLTDHEVPIPAIIIGMAFNGWIPLPGTMPDHDLIQFASYRVDSALDVPYQMLTVGFKDQSYQIPIYLDDSGLGQLTGDLLMARTETTYDLWYTVRLWAELNGYHFENLGREGSNGITGMPPSVTGSGLPVTGVSWPDVVVWMNALSEMTGLEPVYRTLTNDVLKDARGENSDEIDDVIAVDTYTGYRLPTSYEWEMAARYGCWGSDCMLIDDGVWHKSWSKGDHASGAGADISHDIPTDTVAWHLGNSGGYVHPVMGREPNGFQLYDMSGNVSEWIWQKSGDEREIRGGSYLSGLEALRVGHREMVNMWTANTVIGFRMVRKAIDQFVPLGQVSEQAGVLMNSRCHLRRATSAFHTPGKDMRSGING